MLTFIAGKVAGKPRAALMFALLLAALALWGGITVIISQPWLGLRLVAEPDRGLRIVSVDPSGPAAGILEAGDIIISLGDGSRLWLDLKAQDLIEDPDELPRIAAYQDFLQRQDMIYRILHAAATHFILADGRQLRVQAAATRSLSALPPAFWVNQAFALITLLVSAGIWGFQRESAATRLLLLSGVGLFIGATLASLYMARELAFEPELFRMMSWSNCVGNRIFCLAGLGLLWSYPARVAPWPYFTVLVLLDALLVVNQLFLWKDLPGHTFYLDYPILAFLAIFVSGMAWWRSRGNPLHQAVLKLLLLPIFISVFLVMLAFVMPVILIGQPLLPVSGSYMLLLIMYLGLALGVARYRLFEIDRWWVRVWLWFFAGVAILTVDMALVAVGQIIEPYAALGLAVIFVAWLYFPLRQWMWDRFIRHDRGNLEAHLSLLIDRLLRLGQGENGLQLWWGVLEKIFQPLNMDTVPFFNNRVEILDEGLCLRVPCLSDDCSVDLCHPDRGLRLFDSDDVLLAQTLHRIAVRSMTARRPFFQGMLEERKRIMRDLHDDVASRLLTLVHAGGSTSKEAKQALKRLREIIHSLDVEDEITLNMAAAQWRVELLERSEKVGVPFQWVWKELDDDLVLSPHHYLNMGAILREAASNALTHAQASLVKFSLEMNDGRLCICIFNDGVSDVDSLGAGHGIHNMRTRCEELGGDFRYRRKNGTFEVVCNLPLGSEAG